MLLDKRASTKDTYDGSDLGAQTIAILSGIMTWYPDCVCRSLELMKHVWVGCVWIHPNTMRSSFMQNSMTDSSLSVSQVSLVQVCCGITRQLTNSALLTDVPQRIPHISRPLRVFGAATRRNSSRSIAGRKMGRIGVPFSR